MHTLQRNSLGIKPSELTTEEEELCTSFYPMEEMTTDEILEQGLQGSVEIFFLSSIKAAKKKGVYFLLRKLPKTFILLKVEVTTYVRGAKHYMKIGRRQ